MSITRTVSRMILRPGVALVFFIALSASAYAQKFQASPDFVDQALDSEASWLPATFQESPPDDIWPMRELTVTLWDTPNSGETQVRNESGWGGAFVSVKNDTGEDIDITVYRRCDTGTSIDEYKRCSSSRWFERFHLSKDMGKGANELMIQHSKNELYPDEIFLNIKVVSQHGGTIWFRAHASSLRTAEYHLLLVHGAGEIALRYYCAESLCTTAPPSFASPPATPSARPSIVPQQDDTVRREIARIRSGPHEAMPPAQAAPSSLGGQTRMSVKNGTSCTLSVFVSGPTGQSIQLPPGGSQSIGLAPGNYELAASVSCPNVIPFYGTQILAANTQYSENFYIAAQ